MSLLRAINRRLNGLFRRGVVLDVDSRQRQPLLQVRHSATEIDTVSHADAYGFASSPLPGAESFLVSRGGLFSRIWAYLVADRRHRPQNLKKGEVVMYDDLGNQVFFGRDGLVIKAVSDLQITAQGCTINGDLTVNGAVASTGDVTAGSISLQSHVHPGVQSGGSATGAPQ